MARIYDKNNKSSNSPKAVKPGSKNESGFSVTPVSSTSKKYSPVSTPPAKFSWKVFGVVFLLLLLIGLPLCMCVWDIGAPIKGYDN